jgi:uncharacterized membrane protein
MGAQDTGPHTSAPTPEDVARPVRVRHSIGLVLGITLVTTTLFAWVLGYSLN